VSRADDWPRITDLSALDAEDFKLRNTKFLQGNTEYEQTGSESFENLRHQIWATRNEDLRRVIYQFPMKWPLEEQCAGWMHAVVGKHFFPDANHRTAVALLRRLLAENSIEYVDWSLNRLREARKESHTVRREVGTIRLDTLYQKDELYDVWWRFFDDELQAVDAGEQ
jgi:prophage maintenance system killer protein